MLLEKLLGNTPTVLALSTNTVKSKASVLYSHLFVLTAYYQTAEFPNLDDTIRLFHEAWDHPSRELITHIVDKKVFDNIPQKLTAKVIRKRFPQCVACPARNMAQKPVLHSTITTEFIPGEVVQVDV